MADGDWGVQGGTLEVPFGTFPGWVVTDTPPAELVAFYATEGATMIMVEMFRRNAANYVYTGMIIDSLGDVNEVIGRVIAGVVNEVSRLLGGVGTNALQFGVRTPVPNVIFNGSAQTTIWSNGATAQIRSGSSAVIDVDVVAAANKTTRGLGANGTTVSNVYAAMPGTPGDSITKYYSAALSSIRVGILCTAFMSVGVAELEIGIQINSVDTTVLQFFFSNTGIRHLTGGEVKVTGLAAGTYVCAMRWRRASGAGTINWSTVDSFALTLEEVAA